MCADVAVNSFVASSVDKSTTISNCEAHWNLQFLDASCEDWLAYLKHHNIRPRGPALEKTQQINWLLHMPPYVAETVYYWCQLLDQPSGVMYRTVEIYSDFYVTRCHHILEKSSTSPEITNSISSSIVKSVSWHECFSEMKHQSLLHLVSCLQIASKLEDHYTAVTLNTAAELLTEARRPCDLSTILLSEILVLVTLRHDVNFPPISDYVDMLLCHLVLLQKRKPSSSRSAARLLSHIEKINQVCQELLLITLFSRQLIVQRIATGLRGRVNELDNKKYQEDLTRLQRDKMLLAAGTISAACFFVEPSTSPVVMKDLHEHTGIHPSDMAIVSSVLITYLDPDVR